MSNEIKYLKEIANDMKVNGDETGKRQAKWILSLSDDRLETVAGYMEGYADLRLDALRAEHEETLRVVKNKHIIEKLRAVLRTKRECQAQFDTEFNEMLADLNKE